MGLTRSKAHVLLDDPSVEVKVYVRHIEKRLRTRVTLSKDGVQLSRADGRRGGIVCRLGDEVRVRVQSRDQRGDVVRVTGVLYGTTRRSLHPVREFLFAAGFAFQLRRVAPAAATPAPSLAAFPFPAPLPRRGHRFHFTLPTPLPGARYSLRLAIPSSLCLSYHSLRPERQCAFHRTSETNEKRSSFALLVRLARTPRSFSFDSRNLDKWIRLALVLSWARCLSPRRRIGVLRPRRGGLIAAPARAGHAASDIRQSDVTERG